MGRTTDGGGQATRGDDHRHQAQSEEGRQLVGMTTDTRRRVRRAGNYRRVNRAGNSLGGQKSEEGRQLMEGTTDTGTK